MWPEGVAEHDYQRFIDEAEAHANEMWKEVALVCVWYAARQYPAFTTDQVWRELEGQPTTHEPRAMGAIMRRAVKEGFIRATDRYRPSVRANCHGRPMRVWESQIFWKEERTA